MVDSNGHACISDFSLLTIVSDQQTFLSTCLMGGTIPWMSPELLAPKKFGLKKSRLTKESDRYALGMVVYEVLSGHAPFFSSTVPVLDIMRGKRPERPQGGQGGWFTDKIWAMLKLCWKPRPGDRPSLDVVLRCLQDVKGPPKPFLRIDGNTGSDVNNQSDTTTASDSGTFHLFFIKSRVHTPDTTDSLVARDDNGLPVLPPVPRIVEKLAHSTRKIFGATARKPTGL